MAKALGISMFFSPTLTKILAILLAALELVVRTGGLFVAGGALPVLVLFFPQGIMGRCARGSPRGCRERAADGGSAMYPHRHLVKRMWLP